MSDNAKPGDEVILTSRMGNEIRTKFLTWYEYETTKKAKNFGHLYDERAILYFVDELQARWNNGLETTIVSDGDLRSGKSTWSQVLKRIYDSPAYQDKERLKSILAKPDWTLNEFLDSSPLNLNECCFTLKEFYDNIIGHQPSARVKGRDIFDKKFLILDESGMELNSQRWMDRYVQDLKMTMDISAVKRQVIVLNLPFFKGLLRGIREQNASYLTHTIAKWKGSTLIRGTVEIRQGERDRWGGETWWAGYHICRFPGLEDESYNAYHQKKIAYIQSHSFNSEQGKDSDGVITTVLNVHQRHNIPMNELIPCTPYSRPTFYRRMKEANVSSVNLGISTTENKPSPPLTIDD
jgi:hypothetical protein